MTQPDPVNTALAPLRAALLERARSAADDLRAQARDDAAAVLAGATGRAKQLLDDARAEGERDAAAIIAAERARARAAARGAALAAQREVYDRLRERAAQAVRELLADEEQRARLVVRARERLGPDATVDDHPAGGVVARTPSGRLLDASAPALVDETLRGIDVTELWQEPAFPLDQSARDARHD